MATANPFDLLGDDDNGDLSQLIAAQQQKIAPTRALAPAQAQAQLAKSAKLPSKPLPPAQAVREAKKESARGGGRGGGRGYGRGCGYSANENSRSNNGYPGGQGNTEEPDAGKVSERRGGYGGPRRPFHGERRGGYSNGESGDGERTRRTFERYSGTGRGVTEEVVNEGEKTVGVEKPSVEEEGTEVNKENPANEAEEKEPGDKEMTLEEYEKVLEEKRKALQALKTEERKVDVEKEFGSMQQLSNKKDNDGIFIKLGSDKDKRKEFPEKEEKSKKSVSINEFLKPAEGERSYNPGSRGRGRGRGSRGGYGGSSAVNYAAAPQIEDPGEFPTLGGK